jgi:pyruvate formate lyase activating enzyme
MVKGLVYSIKRYSIHDGPGIRQTIFLKGCPLNCWWCHNPESQDTTITNSIRKLLLDGQSFDQIEPIGKLMHVEEVMHEIIKDRIFYDESFGGVTFSGGEPLMQFQFLLELLTECKKQGIHTTVDTSGYADIEVVKKIANLSDLILYDLKHFNDELHIKYTRVSNAIILSNLKWLDQNKKNVVIRFPAVPQINDNEENINKMLDFLKHLKYIRKIALLPFHTIASHKYQQLNMVNKMEGIKALKPEDLIDLKLKFESIGFEVSIGN